jgi:hypothetical protein
MRKKEIVLGLIFITLSLISLEVDAQCAMCKAVVESNIEGGNANAVGKGLNDGIMYLMTIPYLIIAALGYMFYKNWKGNNSAKA